MSAPLSEDLRAFFEEKIDSVELLHVLILLQDRSGEVWTLRKISDELRSSESSVEKRVFALRDRGVLSRDALAGAEVRFLPPDPEMGRRIADAVTYYRAYPYRVVDLIFSKRTDSIRSIADAFRFRKEE